MSQTRILIDPGHGINTPGKRSPLWPDGTQLFEWEFNRDIANRLQRQLALYDIDSIILVPEIEDISLKERCNRANNHWSNNQLFGHDTILVSIHANAGGGTGWECYTSPGETRSDKMATVFYEVARKCFAPSTKVRADYSDGDPDKEDQLYILKHTKCPAVLTENFFMDNYEDCKLLMRDDFRDLIARMHVGAIQKIIDSKL